MCAIFAAALGSVQPGTPEPHYHSCHVRTAQVGPPARPPALGTGTGAVRRAVELRRLNATDVAVVPLGSRRIGDQTRTLPMQCQRSTVRCPPKRSRRRQCHWHTPGRPQRRRAPNPTQTSSRAPSDTVANAPHDSLIDCGGDRRHFTTLAPGWRVHLRVHPRRVTYGP